MNHMRMPESTGLVRYDHLAPAALPVYAVLFGTLALGGFTVLRVLRR